MEAEKGLVNVSAIIILVCDEHAHAGRFERGSRGEAVKVEAAVVSGDAGEAREANAADVRRERGLSGFLQTSAKELASALCSRDERVEKGNAFEQGARSVPAVD